MAGVRNCQVAFLTSVPSIYQPWDLQHLHLPGFFSKIEVRSREEQYRAFCEQAQYVCVQTEWGKRDLIKQYSIDPEKIKVIQWSCISDAFSPSTPAAFSEIVARLGLPETFFFYPAVTWKHKNHEAVIRALWVLRDRHDIRANVCFSGKATEFKGELDRLASKLGVSGQVRYLGFVSPGELHVVYALARALVFPSRFEGFGLPVLEVFRAGLPVLSSSATVLPEVAQDGALYFDPDSPEQIAAHMKAVLVDASLRCSLIDSGRRVMARYSSGRTAAAFQDLYEQIAGVRLSH